MSPKRKSTRVTRTPANLANDYVLSNANQPRRDFCLSIPSNHVDTELPIETQEPSSQLARRYNYKIHFKIN